MKALREQLDQLQQVAGVSPIVQALALVRQLAGRPQSIFDAYALIGALETLEDVARRSGHQDFKRFAAVLTHCKKLPPDARLGDLVTRTLGDDVEREVAKTVSKMFKSSVTRPRVFDHPPIQPRLRDWPYPPMAPSGQPSMRGRCFKCRQFGHFARNCPKGRSPT